MYVCLHSLLLLPYYCITAYNNIIEFVCPPARLYKKYTYLFHVQVYIDPWQQMELLDEWDVNYMCIINLNLWNRQDGCSEYKEYVDKIKPLRFFIITKDSLFEIYSIIIMPQVLSTERWSNFVFLNS